MAWVQGKVARPSVTLWQLSSSTASLPSSSSCREPHDPLSREITYTHTHTHRVMIDTVTQLSSLPRADTGPTVGGPGNAEPPLRTSAPLSLSQK